MEYYYLGIIIILFLLAAMDLTVGVANDAVNFLNSGWGSKAASFRMLMITASAGVFVGALFAGGMMEVARSGVFHPQYFVFGEVIMIFLAVMLTDVILIDFFNTLGLPTSTTVSLVSALLGAAFSFSAIKVSENGEAFENITNYINTDKAFAMISAIFISIAIAFIFGVVLQYISRILFSFSYERYRRIGGSIFGGIAIGLISYFIFFKGMKSASFIDKDTVKWVTENILMLEGVLMAGLTLLFILIQSLFKTNIFKIVVIYGTFALAMSFAGNDLVNFLGPSMAGLDAYNAYTAAGSGDPFALKMTALEGGAPTPVFFLMAAGAIMVLTLWFSKKTRTVIRTSVDLGRQNEGVEKFDANPVARSIVKMAIGIGKLFTLIRIPALGRWIETRFDKSGISNDPDAPAFDMVRAAVGLTVGSSLIAIGTSMKLPLSTTYVTFMVAMGTSLADRAWDRESAVYRVSGVVTVIGGWFVTAFLAFAAAALIAFILHTGEVFGVIVMISLAVFLLIRSKIMHRKREKKISEAEEIMKLESTASDAEIIELSKSNVLFVLDQIPEVLLTLQQGVQKEKLKTLKKADKLVKEIDKRTIAFKTSINSSIGALGENYLATGEYYLKNIDLLREIAVSLSYITHPVYQHLDNQHKNFNKTQVRDLIEMCESLNLFTTQIRELVVEDIKMEGMTDLKSKQAIVCEKVHDVRLQQIKRVKNKEAASRSNLLFFNIITEIQNLTKFLAELTENELKYNKIKP